MSNDHAPPPPPHDAPISTEPAVKTGRWLAIAAAAVAVLLVAGFALAYAVRGRAERSARAGADDAAAVVPAVEVVAVESAPHTAPLTLPGQTAGWYQSTLYARVDGYIDHWTADIGDPVKAGQTLATIATPDLDQQQAAARAKAAASDAAVAVARSNADIGRLTYERWRDSPKGVVSEQEREEKHATATAAVARLAEAQAQAKLDAANVERFAALESFRNVTAPYDGVITARKVDVGNLVTAGSSANTTSLYSLAQVATIRVFVDVPQNAAAGVRDGVDAAVTTGAVPGRTFRGRVARSAHSVDPATRTERVEIDVPNADRALVPGLYVTATFELPQPGLARIPAAAVLFRPDGLDVAVVAADGTVSVRPITVARDDGETLEVSAGVAAGDRVALNLSHAVGDGDKVRPVGNGLAPRPPEPGAVAVNHAPVDHPGGGAGGQ